MSEKKQGSCYGDSGGPAFTGTSMDDYRLVGVLSHIATFKEYKCDGRATAYASIEYYKDWIFNNTHYRLREGPNSLATKIFNWLPAVLMECVTLIIIRIHGKLFFL